MITLRSSFETLMTLTIQLVELFYLTYSIRIDPKTKELIALAIGVAARCDGCIGFHVRTLVKMGMTLQELEEVLGVAVYMGGGPSLMYAANALEAFKEFTA